MRHERKWNGEALRVVAELAAACNVAASKIQTTDRHASIARVRAIGFMVLRNLRHSFCDIAQMCGGYDHTSVLMACRKIEARPDDVAIAAKIAAKVLEARPTGYANECKRREALFRANCEKWRMLCGLDYDANKALVAGYFEDKRIVVQAHARGPQ
jgi:hypothetical protein